MLVFAFLLSLAVGARAIPLADVVDALRHGGEGQEAAIVNDVRMPRTLLGLLVGAALGVAGAMMQTLTRNPLADPGLLGVNAGAAAAVVIGFALGVTSATGAVWPALIGAAITSLAVYAIGSAGRGGATPVRLALAGTAITAVLAALTYAIAISDRRLLQQYNYWSVGALGGRDQSQLEAVLPFILAGGVLAVLLARPLNAMALGTDTAKGLGSRVGRTRVGGAVAITLLCGAGTAAVGPFYFLGLAVPHVGRALCGPDERWILVYSAVLGAALMLIADVIGRVLISPSELPTGVMVSIIGAPVFIALVRRKRIAAL